MKIWQAIMNVLMTACFLFGLYTAFTGIERDKASILIVGVILVVIPVVYFRQVEHEKKKGREAEQRRKQEREKQWYDTIDGKKERELSTRTKGLSEATKEEIAEWVDLDGKRQRFIESDGRGGEPF